MWRSLSYTGQELLLQSQQHKGSTHVYLSVPWAQSECHTGCLQAAFTCEFSWHPSVPAALLLLKGPHKPWVSYTPQLLAPGLAQHPLHQGETAKWLFRASPPSEIDFVKGANLSTSPFLWYHSLDSLTPLLQKHELMYHGKKSACLATNPKLWKTATTSCCHSQRKEIGRSAVP